MQDGRAAPDRQSMQQEELAALAKTADCITSSACVEWFPENGCALLALGHLADGPDVRPELDRQTLLLVGLDSWAFDVHAR